MLTPRHARHSNREGLVVGVGAGLATTSGQWGVGALLLVPSVGATAPRVRAHRLFGVSRRLGAACFLPA